MTWRRSCDPRREDWASRPRSRYLSSPRSIVGGSQWVARPFCAGGAPRAGRQAPPATPGVRWRGEARRPPGTPCASRRAVAIVASRRPRACCVAGPSSDAWDRAPLRDSGERQVHRCAKSHPHGVVRGHANGSPVITSLTCMAHLRRDDAAGRAWQGERFRRDGVACQHFALSCQSTKAFASSLSRLKMRRNLGH
jgi:hypothetical protein